MAFGEKKGKLDRRIRSRNALGDVLDVINFTLGLFVVITSFFVIVNHSKYQKMFPIVFLCSALLNLSMAFKSFKRHELIKVFSGGVAGIFLIVMMVISFIGLW